MNSPEPSVSEESLLSGRLRYQDRVRTVAQAIHAVVTTNVSVPARWRGRLTWPLVLGAWGLWCLLIFQGDSPFGDLSGMYTDHLRHSFAVWVFVEKGWALFRQPFEQLWNVDYPHPLRRWGEMAFNYPPGTLLLFTPLSLLGKYVPMTTMAFGRWGVCFTLLLSHVALVAIARATRGQPTVLRTWVLIFSALHLLRAGVEGFYDGAWMACAAWGVAALREDKPVAAIFGFLAAAMLHYRAVVIFPWGVVALWRALNGKSWREWPWFALGAVVVTGVVCVTTFLWMYPTTTWYQPDPPVILKAPLGARFVGVVLATAAAAWVAWQWSDAVTAWGVLAVGAFSLVDVFCWWHATVGLAPFWTLRTWRRPWVVSPVLMVWLTWVQRQAWGGQPNTLFKALKQAGFWWS